MSNHTHANCFRVSDAMWRRIEPLLPQRHNPHPERGGRPPRADRDCFDAIFFLLRTGCQWNALNETGLCPSSTAHDRFQAWEADGFFERLWDAGLQAYDELRGIDWSFISIDGAQTKAPLGGEKNRSQPDRSRQAGRQTQRGRRRPRRAAERGDRRGQRPRHVSGGHDAAADRGPRHRPADA